MKFTVVDSGRLDTAIALQDAHFSRAKIQKLIKSGHVQVNAKVIKKTAYILEEGDQVDFDESKIHETVESAEIDPVDMHLEVLFEDDAVMVINKPAGISVHPGHSMDAEEKTVLNGIAFLFLERKIPFSADAVLAHRLDKPTTGCLCVVKNYNSHMFLQKQFQDRTIKKYYLAIVAGVPEHATATIDAPIGRNTTDRTKMSALKTSTSKEALTTYHVVDHVQEASLVRCDLHTGRTHQIRVHLSSIGHPILGDDSYFSSKSVSLSEQYCIEDLCLHAEQITFVSPADNAEHTVKAPLSETLLQAKRVVGLR